MWQFCPPLCPPEIDWCLESDHCDQLCVSEARGGGAGCGCHAGYQQGPGPGECRANGRPGTALCRWYEVLLTTISR